MLWAVEMRSVKERPEGMLIGEAWIYGPTPPLRFEGQTSRCLLFKTRGQARRWCREAEARSRRHNPSWRFRPVRVRETVVPAE